MAEPRVLLASYHYPPTTRVGGLRAQRLARGLRERGFQVAVVCATPDAGMTGTHRTPLPGEVDPFPALRIPTGFPLGYDPSARPRTWTGRQFRRILRRAVVVLTTRDRSWHWARQAVAAVAPGVTEGRHDVIVLSTPPHGSAPPFIALANRTGTPIVCDLRDVWPAPSRFPAGDPRSGPRRQRWLRGVADTIVDRADHLVFTTEQSRALLLLRRPDLDPAATSVIPNAFGVVDVPHPAQPVAPFRLCYTGSLAYGRDQLLDVVLAGMATLSETGGPEVQLVAASNDPEPVTRRASAHGVAHQVSVRGWLDGGEAAQLQRDSHALLVLQPGSPPSIAAAVPGKMFDYMARRKPMLAFVPASGAAADLVRRHGLGSVLTDTSPLAVADLLRRLWDDVVRTPVLPPPPEQYSEAATTEAYAALLRRLNRGGKSLPTG